MYVYKKTESAGFIDGEYHGDLFTVGFYQPNGKWYPEEDLSSRDEAAQRVHWLNGGHSDDDKTVITMVTKARDTIKTYIDEVGGCDHSVGLCCCEDYYLVEELETFLKRNKP